MPLLRQKIIQREDLRANPSAYYIFGDNEERVGLGGQAREMRGEPNALGIATLRAPGQFWSNDPKRVIWQNRVLLNDFSIPLLLLKRGKLVIFPLDGIGTGLADLENRSPQSWVQLQSLIRQMKELG